MTLIGIEIMSKSLNYRPKINVKYLVIYKQLSILKMTLIGIEIMSKIT